MQRPKFTTGNLYHIYNRGTDKRDIFMDESDYLRASHNLWEFNDQNPAPANHILRSRKQPSLEVRLPTVAVQKMERPPRELLVKIHAFVLMKNHYHLILEQIVEDGISKFMQKFGTGYTNYFNQKHERNGVLFQGKFKAIHIDNDPYFLHLPHYIHCNPLDYLDYNWREGGLKDINNALNFLKNYRWSSFLDYAGIKNFPSVTYRKLLTEGLSKDWKAGMRRWLSEFNEENLPEYLEKWQ
ncbi:MAG: transposase [bacterium]|nr:transposase [bacterium]